MGNANFLGRYLVLVLPLFAACSVKATRSKPALLWAGGGMLGLATLVLTYSRASLVGLVVGGVVFIALTRSRACLPAAFGPAAWRRCYADCCHWPYLTDAQRFKPACVFQHHCQPSDRSS